MEADLSHSTAGEPYQDGMPKNELPQIQNKLWVYYASHGQSLLEFVKKKKKQLYRTHQMKVVNFPDVSVIDRQHNNKVEQEEMLHFKVYTMEVIDYCSFWT